MRYLIDTNICIYVMNEHPPKVIQRFKKKKIGDIGISAITLAELQYGVSKSQNKQQNQQRINEFMAPFDILNFTAKATQSYGDIRDQLAREGNIIGPFDLLIAAQALSEGLILVTNNEQEFSRVSGLKLENWAV